MLSLARRTWPLIHAPSGPARKATALAISSGWQRPTTLDDRLMIRPTAAQAWGHLGLIPQVGNGRRIADIGADGEGLATVLHDLRGHAVCVGGVAGIVDDDGEAIPGKAARDGRTDAAGSPRDNGDSGIGGAHGFLPVVSRAKRRQVNYAHRVRKDNLLRFVNIVRSVRTISPSADQTMTGTRQCALHSSDAP